MASIQLIYDDDEHNENYERGKIGDICHEEKSCLNGEAY